MRLLLLGSEGLLGTAVQAVAEADCRVSLVAAGRRDVDITRSDEVERVVRATRPDVVVNTAAFMPADRCDDSPSEAYEVNALGPRWVSRACAQIDAIAVYVSTDFVFDGEASSPYHPGAQPRPVLTYGVTKLAGEHETRLGCKRNLVVRTACLFGPPPRSPNARCCFVDRVLEKAFTGADLAITDNIVTSPTYTYDFAAMLLALLHDGTDSGTHHLVNQGSASWYDLCRRAVTRAGLSVQIEHARHDSFVSSPRPLCTPLAGELPETVQRINRSWRAALDEYLLQRGWTTPALAQSTGRSPLSYSFQ